MVGHFDELVQHIQSRHTILAASDGSYLEDGRASVEWAFDEPSEEYDGDSRVVLCVKILLGDTIFAGGHLDSNSAYRAEAVSVFTVTIVLHFLGLYYF